MPTLPLRPFIGRVLRPRLAIAVGPRSLTVVELRPGLRGARLGRVGARAIQGPGEEGDWPGLAEALREVREELGGAGAEVDVALLPPLAHAKVLALPPLPEGALRALLLRNARRYFLLSVPGEVLADVWHLARPRRGRPVSGLAVCALEGTLRSLAAAVEAAGCGVGALVPASLALLRALQARGALGVAEREALALCAPGWCEVVVLGRSRPTRVQPFPSLPGDPREVAAQVEGALRRGGGESAAPGRVVVCGSPGVAGELAARLRGAGPEGPVAVEEVEVAPEVLAAIGAALSRGTLPRLRFPEHLRAERRRELWRAATLAGATAAVLAATAALRLHNLGEELDAVRRNRGQIAPVVAQVDSVRRRILWAHRTLAAVAELERTAPRPTRDLAALTGALPGSAYLESLTLEAQQVRLSGYAGSVSEVVAALDSTPRLGRVTLTAPVRRDELRGREEFQLLLAPPGAAPAAGSARR